MALIDRNALQSVIELGYRVSDTKTEFVGTGILYADNLRRNAENNSTQMEVYLFTNRHVLELVAKQGDFISMRFIKQDGSSGIVHHPLKDAAGNPQWLGHYDEEKVDVGVLALRMQEVRDHGFLFRIFKREVLWTKSEMEGAGCTEGDRIFVVGYPYSIQQISRQSRAFPVVRDGIISRVSDLFAGETEVFLIDATVYPGNSGSPVFTVPEAMSILNTKSVTVSAIIGFVSEYLDYKDVAISESTGRPRVFFTENSGLARVETIDNMFLTLEHLKTKLAGNAARYEEEAKIIAEAESTQSARSPSVPAPLSVTLSITSPLSADTSDGSPKVEQSTTSGAPIRENAAGVAGCLQDERN